MAQAEQAITRVLSSLRSKTSDLEFEPAPIHSEDIGKLPPYAKYAHQHHPRLVKFVHSMAFETLMAMTIAFNCFTVGISVEECPPDSSVRSHYKECPEVMLALSENLCTLVFLLEWLLRGFCEGFAPHFQSISRSFDTFLVWGAGVVLTWVMDPLFNTGREMRLLTVLRAFRLLRVVRVARFHVKEMWLLFRGLAMSCKTLVSAIVVFVFVNYLFAILAVTLIGDSTLFVGLEEYEEVHSYFQGLDQSMFTLLQIVTGDSWASGIARPILTIMPSMWFFFVAYIAVASLVLMNLITAIIVDNAIQMSKDDEESRVRDLKEEQNHQFTKLQSIFKALDADQSGSIDQKEFTRRCAESQEIVDQFQLLGFEEHALNGMFQELAGVDGVMTMDEFFMGLRSMLGMAKGVDIVHVRNDVGRLHRRLDMLFEVVERATKGGALQGAKEVAGPTVPIHAHTVPMEILEVAAHPACIDQKEIALTQRGTEMSCPTNASVPNNRMKATGAESENQAMNDHIKELTKRRAHEVEESVGMVDAICQEVRVLMSEFSSDLKASIAEMNSQQLQSINCSVQSSCQKQLPMVQPPQPLGIGWRTIRSCTPQQCHGDANSPSVTDQQVCSGAHHYEDHPNGPNVLQGDQGPEVTGGQA